MLNIVLFGPPGAGKGTQSQNLVKEYKLIHLSTGDLLRSEMKAETDLGKQAKSLIDSGKLVPDAVVIGMIEHKLDEHQNAAGFIFDGFPRTEKQAEALDELMNKHQDSITGMIALDVPEDELVKRLLERGKESGRSDDQNEEVIRQRLDEYEKKTAVLKEYFSKQDKFESIDGVGSIDEIFGRIKSAIEKLR